MLVVIAVFVVVIAVFVVHTTQVYCPNTHKTLIQMHRALRCYTELNLKKKEEEDLNNNKFNYIYFHSLFKYNGRTVKVCVY